MIVLSPGEECRRVLRFEMRGRPQSLWSRIRQRSVQGDDDYDDYNDDNDHNEID